MNVTRVFESAEQQMLSFHVLALQASGIDLGREITVDDSEEPLVVVVVAATGAVEFPTADDTDPAFVADVSPVDVEYPTAAAAALSLVEPAVVVIDHVLVASESLVHVLFAEFLVVDVIVVV